MWYWHYCYLHFSGEETEAQECNASSSGHAVDKHEIKTLNSDPHSLDSQVVWFLSFKILFADTMPPAQSILLYHFDISRNIYQMSQELCLEVGL